MVDVAVASGSVIVAVTVYWRALVASFAGMVTVRVFVPVPEVSERVGFVPSGPVTLAVQALPSSAWTVTVAVVTLKLTVCVAGVTENSSGLWVMVTSWFTPLEVTVAVRVADAVVLLFAANFIRN